MAGSPGNPTFGTENSPAVKFSSERQPESNGRPLGSRNRSTIARKILEMTAIAPEVAIDHIRQTHPEITDKLTTEEIATIMIAGNAMKGDVKSYEALMNSAYGAPKQEIENLNTNISVLSNDPLDATADDSITED